MQWETTVGDNRAELLRAFQLAGQRADAVLVNGGLGPTVDDLSQEIAAQAAGVELGCLKTPFLGYISCPVFGPGTYGGQCRGAREVHGVSPPPGPLSG